MRPHTRIRLPQPQTEDKRSLKKRQHISLVNNAASPQIDGLSPVQNMVLGMQQSQGNAAVGRLLARRAVGGNASPQGIQRSIVAFDSQGGNVQRWPWDDDESESSESSSESSGSTASDYSSSSSGGVSEYSGGGAQYTSSSTNDDKSDDSGDSGGSGWWPFGGDDIQDEEPAASGGNDKPWWQFWGDDKQDDDSGDGGDDKPWWQFWGDDKQDDDPASGGDEAEEELPSSGSVDPIVGSPVAMGMACDTPSSKRRKTGARPRLHDAIHEGIPTRDHEGRPLKVRTHFAISTDTHEGGSDGAFMAHDDAKSFSVGNNLDFGSINEYGATGIPGNTAFGYTAPTFTIDNVRWTRDGDTINIYARVFVKVNWAVRGNNNTNIPSGNDPFITATNWENIADDLTPNASGEAPRNLYWASDLTVQHEMFHVTEFVASSKSQLPSLSSWLNSQSISLPEDTPSDRMILRINSQISGLMGGMKGKLEGAVKAAFDSGGELRAYKDGKAGYQGRANDIRANAKKKGWTK